MTLQETKTEKPKKFCSSSLRPHFHRFSPFAWRRPDVRKEKLVQLFCRERVKTGSEVRRGVRADIRPSGHYYICMCVWVSLSGRAEKATRSSGSWGEEASKLTFEPLLFLLSACVVVGGVGLMESSQRDHERDVAYIGGDGAPFRNRKMIQNGVGVVGSQLHVGWFFGWVTSSIWTRSPSFLSWIQMFSY